MNKKFNYLFGIFTLGFLLFTTTIKAEIQITKTDSKISIENTFLKRSFSITNNKVTPLSWENKRTENTLFTPSEGSEEFLVKPIVNLTVPIALERTAWTATVDSWNPDGGSGSAAAILDGDLTTIWHTNYGGGSGSQTLPHWLQIDLGTITTFQSFCYVPRQVGTNGNIKNYQLYVSDTKETLTQPEHLVKEGTFILDGIKPVWVGLPKAITGRYLRLVEISSQNGAQYGACAEFYVSNDPYNKEEAIIKASDMTLKEVRVEDLIGGKRLIFDLLPYTYETIDWDIDLVIELEENNHFMHKYLQISVPEEQREKAQIDWIDLEHFNVNQAQFTWSHPEMNSGVGGLSGYLIALGQPLYVDGMFLGSEFPQTDNTIKESIGYTRYYSGKSLKQLEQEERLKDGVFTTWKNVLGATKSLNNMDVIRTDFYAYLNTIARPTKLRIQYNSWYDWMMNIDESNILASFQEIEGSLSRTGVRPIDSYVIDDGWNAYGPWKSSNKSGFWEFNNKFPNGLTKPANFAHKVNSNFGLWLGPRGGYNYNAEFGHFLEEQGNGTYNVNNADIVTGDKVYLAKLKEFFLKQQDDYGINYWKLDGFCARVPQASTNGRYISGGENGMYYFTEHWERWYKLISQLYTNAETNQQDLWLNLTCYLNPSPWILQWCNSVWMQISLDMGRKAVDGRTRDLDQLLSYRDGRYFDFIKTRQFQFPFSHIFNHDPVYGKTGCVAPNSMDDDEFRAYLYMMSTRGTAFWELLYSYNLIDEGNKWQINAEALKFLETNYSILRHSMLIGKTPESGNVYGFSCWNTEEGIVSLRNPKNSEQTFTLKLDRTIGVPENATNLWRSLIMRFNSTKNYDNTTSFSYNDEITITLQPGEIRIWKFSPNKDASAADLLITKANGTEKQVFLEFNEPVSPSVDNFVLIKEGKEKGKPTNVNLLADYRTVCLTFSEAFTSNQAYRIKVTNLCDWNKNETNTLSSEFYHNPNGLLFEITTKEDILNYSETELANLTPSFLFNKSYQLNTAKSINGVGDFGISFTINTATNTGILISQEGAFEVALNQGQLKFTVGQLVATTETTINDEKTHQIDCTREKNGLLKLYVDGKLITTAYDKNIINEPLTTNKIMIGSESIQSIIGDFKLWNRAHTFKEIARRSLLTDKTVALSYLDLSKGICGNNLSLTANKCVRGSDLMLKGKKYTIGVGMQGPAELHIQLNGATRFRSLVGVDDSADPNYGGTVNQYGVCDYQLFKDGKELFKTGHLNRTDKQLDTLDIDVKDWKFLSIKISNGPDGTPWADIPDFVNSFFDYEGVIPKTVTKQELTVLGEVEIQTKNKAICVETTPKQLIIHIPQTEGVTKRIQLIDLTGKILTKNERKEEKIILTHNLSKGTYLLKIECQRRNYQEKIILH